MVQLIRYKYDKIVWSEVYSSDFKALKERASFEEVYRVSSVIICSMEVIEKRRHDKEVAVRFKKPICFLNVFLYFRNVLDNLYRNDIVDGIVVERIDAVRNRVNDQVWFFLVTIQIGADIRAEHSAKR